MVGSLKFIEVRVYLDTNTPNKKVEKAAREMVGGVLERKGNLKVNGKYNPKKYDLECVALEEVKYEKGLSVYILGFDI